MPLNISDEDSIVRQSQSYVRAELPELDPSTEKSNFITGLVVALAKTLFHWYLALKDFADRQVHPQTATGSVLYKGWWSALTGLSRNPVTAASGSIIATGTAGAIIPNGSELSIGSDVYETMSGATLLTQATRASSLTYSGGLAIFETNEAHGLASGMVKTISGANDAAYNGVFEITVTAENEFTYTPLSAPVAAAGSDVLATSVFARISVRAQEAGKDQNVDGGQMTFNEAIDNVDTVALVTFAGVNGGTDLEDQEDFRDRLLDALASTLGVFTAEEIRDVVKSVPGVTRVFIRKAQVNPADGWPLEGQTKILFMRDNDANPIPSPREVEIVKEAIVSKISPAHMAVEDVIVQAPVPVAIDFEFASITPDTASMRLSITARLVQFFDEKIGIGADLPKRLHTDLNLIDLHCAIKDTIDMDTGEQLISFDLTTPSVDTAVDPDSIPILGSVVFAS